jgi:hypothetical protein
LHTIFSPHPTSDDSRSHSPSSSLSVLPGPRLSPILNRRLSNPNEMRCVLYCQIVTGTRLKFQQNRLLIPTCTLFNSTVLAGSSSWRA